jgi:hypothetical protein
MIGVICTKDILFHPVVTIKVFGWRVYFRAVFKGHGDTFLSLLQREGFFKAARTKETELIDRCVRLELQSEAIYRSLAERFSKLGPFREFLNELAEEEREHADLLTVCKLFAGEGRFTLVRPGPWLDSVPLLEQQMQQVVASLDKIASIDDVVALILQIEGSEFNSVLVGVIRSTDSPFVRNLGPFRRAVKQHIDYICTKISKLTPSASLACQELRKKI